MNYAKEMSNAKDEFLDHVNGKPRVLCVKITLGDECCESKKEEMLKTGYSEKDFSDFLEKLNFEYDEGYGCQELFGFIWYDDGTWSEREEYDGSEWWKYKKLPEIPEELKG